MSAAFVTLVVLLVAAAAFVSGWFSGSDVARWRTRREDAAAARALAKETEDAPVPRSLQDGALREEWRQRALAARTARAVASAIEELDIERAEVAAR